MYLTSFLLIKFLILVSIAGLYVFVRFYKIQTKGYIGFKLVIIRNSLFGNGLIFEVPTFKEATS